MIEVLIAALILGIGLLGIVALQTSSMQYNRQGYWYSQATFFASDIADRIRANTSVADSYTIALSDDPPSSVTDCESSSCSVSQLRDWDISQWLTALAEKSTRRRWRSR